MVTGEATVLARFLPGDEGGSYLAKDLEERGEGLFFTEPPDMVLDIVQQSQALVRRSNGSNGIQGTVECFM